tara:strand:+ start:864 stop:1772 length:909 start_codon:yes stop_codon:yes gene_type:complete
MMEDAELVGDEDIDFLVGLGGGSEECKIRLSKDNIAWEYSNNIYKNKNRKYKFPLNEIILNLIKGERGIILNSDARLKIIKKNNTENTRDWNIWNVYFDYKLNKDIVEFVKLFKIRREEKIKLEQIRIATKKAEKLISEGKYSRAIDIWKHVDDGKEAEHFTRISAKKLENEKNYDGAMELWNGINVKEETIRVMKIKAEEREKARDYESAIEIWEVLGEIEEAARVRKLKAEQSAVKVAQNVIQGNQITKTEINDSVINRSNVGGGKSSKAEELREAKSLFEEGLIDDDEFKQMKKEILGK